MGILLGSRQLWVCSMYYVLQCLQCSNLLQTVLELTVPFLNRIQLAHQLNAKIKKY